MQLKRLTRVALDQRAPLPRYKAYLENNLICAAELGDKRLDIWNGIWNQSYSSFRKYGRVECSVARQRAIL